MKIDFVLNGFGQHRGRAVNAGAELLRETLGLTGTHVGCDTSQCGACVVHVDGSSVKSCTLLAVASMAARVTTVEGLGPGPRRCTRCSSPFMRITACSAAFARRAC